MQMRVWETKDAYLRAHIKGGGGIGYRKYTPLYEKGIKNVQNKSMETTHKKKTIHYGLPTLKKVVMGKLARCREFARFVITMCVPWKCTDVASRWRCKIYANPVIWVACTLG